MVAVSLVVALLAAACGGGGTGGSEIAAGSDTPVLSEDEFVAGLAAAGIGVYEPGAMEPQEPVEGQESPLRLSDLQAENAYFGASLGSGLAGEQLDAMVELPLLPEATEPIPLSQLIGAWVIEAPGPAAKLARRLVGDQDLTQHSAAVYPLAVLLLFAADMTPRGDDATTPVPPDATTQGFNTAPIAYREGGVSGPCGLLNVVNQTITDALGALSRLPYVEEQPGLAEPFRYLINAGIFGARLGALFGQGLVETLLAPIKAVIAPAAAVVAAAAQIMTAVVPWAGTITPDPRTNMRTTTRNPGTFELKVRSVTSRTEWPAEIVQCARFANVQLPSLKPHGGNVTWKLVYQFPVDLIDARIGSPGPLSDDSTSVIDYETVAEPPDVANGEAHEGIVEVSAAMHRTDLEQLRDALFNAAVQQLPGWFRDTVGSVILPIIQDKLNSALTGITNIQDASAAGVLRVTYHTRDDTTTSSSTSTTEPTTTPRRPSPPMPTDACSLVGGNLGQYNAATPLICQGITSPPPGQKALLTVYVTINPPETMEQLRRSFPALMPISGLGWPAYGYQAVNPEEDIGAEAGVTVDVGSWGLSVAISGNGASLDQAIGLARAALSRCC